MPRAAACGKPIALHPPALSAAKQARQSTPSRGFFIYRNQEDAAVRKKFVRAWKAQSEHTYKSLFIMFIFRQKKLCLAAPSRGFFLMANSEKTNAHVLL